MFLCPNTRDHNDAGRELGSRGAPGGRPLSPHAVSYAGMGDNSVGAYLCSKMGKSTSYAASKMAIRDDFPPNEPMACDDTDEPINHGTARNGGMNVLFFDSHVEYWPHTRVDLKAGVGRGDLCALVN